MAIKSLAVFCGSKTGNNPLFEAHAKKLGHILADKNITLIYGGGNKGIMGAVANAALENNGIVIGIIPQVLTEWEAHHNGITELIIVDSMHTRKKMMYEKCDAAIILPGGFGTLDELFEIVTWNQLSIHDKPVFILNTDGFYSHLIKHIEKIREEEFLYEAADKRIIIIDTPDELVQYL